MVTVGTLATFFLTNNLDPSGGTRTGLNAFHWAANRGQKNVVELLIRAGAPLETRNHYGGTVLGCAVWSAVHETKPAHLEIIKLLLAAGANPLACDHPSGRADVDELIAASRRKPPRNSAVPCTSPRLHPHKSRFVEGGNQIRPHSVDQSSRK